MHEDIEWLKENAVTKSYLENRFEAERGHTKITVREETRKVIHEELDLNNMVLGTILEVKIGETRQEIVDAMKISYRETAKQLKDHRERIETLEDLNGSKSHKN